MSSDVLACCALAARLLLCSMQLQLRVRVVAAGSAGGPGEAGVPVRGAGRGHPAGAPGAVPAAPVQRRGHLQQALRAPVAAAGRHVHAPGARASLLVRLPWLFVSCTAFWKLGACGIRPSIAGSR